jgi:hypothetical protein
MVVAFFHQDQLITHRVVWTSGGRGPEATAWVWGDSSPRSLSPVLAGDIIGRVACIVRGERRRSFWLSRPGGLLAIPIGLLLQTAVRLKSLLTGKNL